MKKITAVILVLIMALNIAGCVSVPEKKYMDRLSDEDKKEVQKGIEFNRSMWQLGSLLTGALLSTYGMNERDINGNIITFSFLPLSFAGLTSLFNLHTYRENDAERNAMYMGMLAGAIAAVGLSAYYINENFKQPNQFSLLSIYSIWLVFPLSLSCGGLGAMIGKLFNE
ncbi:MAG: hypothetical protein CVV21_01300 [Candidatus Goldiibacteriota bacterium HGW-Goldbacteria-1]|jgi:hypothetical protein|nr:MAG: hypothetical protein CVV21_01300 [Candidatus Goldiibacteriota bacterium HGW-Goldbacteria-1]